MNEEWRPVVGFAEGYEVSDWGRVRCWVRRTRSRSHRLSEPFILAATPAKHGYYVVTIRGANGERSTLYVHSLVLAAFVGPRPSPNLQALHRNGDGYDNRPDNLRWGTQAENEADKVAVGRDNRGERHPLAKLSAADVAEIRRLAATGVAQKDIARRFSVSQGAVYLIVQRKRWAHVLTP